MATHGAPPGAEIVRRTEPHFAMVEIPALGVGEPVLAPGVIASPHCVALSTRFIEGRDVEELTQARIRHAGRRWEAYVIGLTRRWETCCFTPVHDGLPTPPVPLRWSHTLREAERIFAVTPLPGGGARTAAGRVEVLERCDDNEPWERSHIGLVCFDAPALPGAFIFDCEARLAGVVGRPFDEGGRFGALVPAERLSGVPEVGFYTTLAKTGSHAELLKKAVMRRSGDPRVLALAAIAARHLSDLPLSLKVLDILLKSEPDHPWANFERAVVLQELGRAGESALALHRAVALDPDVYGWRSPQAPR